MWRNINDTLFAILQFISTPREGRDAIQIAHMTDDSDFYSHAP